MAYPKKLNIGSGKDFKEDFLNLDIDDTWNPDIVIDLNIPLHENGDLRFQSDRFGEIELKENYFDLIIAYDVLEHLINLTNAMKTCLDLLKEGGEFDILVPYDLSFGAWQDPTHVRAFNDKSWLYYSDWFWYLGWSEYRFKVEKSEYILSDFGKLLIRDGKNAEYLSRTPRAVDSIKVLLKKIPLSNEDLATFEHYRKGSKK